MFLERLQSLGRNFFSIVFLIRPLSAAFGSDAFLDVSSHVNAATFNCGLYHSLFLLSISSCASTLIIPTIACSPGVIKCLGRRNHPNSSALSGEGGLGFNRKPGLGEGGPWVSTGRNGATRSWKPKLGCVFLIRKPLSTSAFGNDAFLNVSSHVNAATFKCGLSL